MLLYIAIMAYINVYFSNTSNSVQYNVNSCDIDENPLLLFEWSS